VTTERQETGVRRQETGVRRQESGDRSQESEVRSQKSEVKKRQPYEVPFVTLVTFVFRPLRHLVILVLRHLVLRHPRITQTVKPSMKNQPL
jgi:hypothetical protein